MEYRLAPAKNIAEMIVITVVMIAGFADQICVMIVYIRRICRMGENEIKDLIQTELKESGYMYTRGCLRVCIKLEHLT